MILFLLLFFSIPMVCMEMEQYDIFLQNDLDDEHQLLLEAHDEPENQMEEVVIHQAMNEDIPEGGFLDGSRRFYDSAASRKAKLRAYRECLKFTGLWMTIGAALGGAGFLIFDLILLGMGALIYRQEVAYTLRNGLPWLLPPEIAFSGGISFLVAAPVAIVRDLLPAFEYHRCDWLDRIVRQCACAPISYKDTEIPSLAFDFIDDSETSPIRKQYVLDYEAFFASSRLWKISKHIYPPHRKINSIIQKILTRQLPICKEYAQIAFKLKKIFLEKIGKDATQYLCNFLKDKNILAHITAHGKWSSEYCHITDKENAVLRYLYKPVWIRKLGGLFEFSILAENGWCSFKYSEKYPILLSSHYFDSNNRIYRSLSTFDPADQTVEAKAYFPFCRELAHFYKFEEDPAYAKEFENPSNEKIGRLLALRQDLIEQKRTIGMLEE